MTKAELIDAVSQKAGVSKADAERTIAEFFDLVVSSAKQGDKVAWPGFGSFSTSKRKARIGRNPQTGAPRAGESINCDEVQLEFNTQSCS